MQNSLSNILEQMRLNSKSEFEKGEYFEKLVKVFLENDTLQGQSYDKVWLFKEWAVEQGLPSNDTGIDLVARHSDGSGFCAIQCKFYASDGTITKKHIDSFISASATDNFVSLVIVDTTLKDFSTNLLATLDHLDKPWHRIALSDLEQSRIDWSVYFRDATVKLAEPKEMREHQQQALDAVRTGLAEADRGKIIMACGTGKTFTSLKIAEQLAGKGKLVLYMVPSLALMSQTVREWKNDCDEDFTAYSVCSDVKVGKRGNDGDVIQFTIHDLAFPATTNPKKISDQVNERDTEKMTVVFSTYQSIDVITQSQKQFDLPAFDWIICDEAHRTTGVSIGGDDSNFVRIHSNDYVVGKKRLYMTATPKIYGENVKSKAKQHDATLASMDDVEKFGEVLFYRGFSWAVENDLLSDYKVIVLAVDEGIVSSGVQNRLAESSEMKLDDATKIIGCYKALTKHELIGETDAHPKPMQRAIAFCKNIAISKMVTDEFSAVVEEFNAYQNTDDNSEPKLDVQTRHVDGTFNAKQREERLTWLKEDTDDATCRILTNARCLSEGVDVPALDSIIFMHPRKSQIDVVQSIGRVMRKSAGKKLGYVILPVAIPHGVEPDEALNDNERYQVVWQTLNALRSHDDRLDGAINQISIGEDVSDKIQIVGITEKSITTTAQVDDVDFNRTKATKRSDIGGSGGDRPDDEIIEKPAEQLGFVFDDLTQALRAKIVEKCGTREHWDKWANDIAKIAETHITRISTIVAKEGEEQDAFNAFLSEIRDDLNPEISEKDAIEMLAQHLITKPVFDTLFRDNHFTANNPVSKAMEIVLGQLDHHNIGKEAETLQGFYDSVRRQSEGIKTASGRQALVVRLYDQFFRSAFPAMTQKLGIVYTPVEVVDFIIHSVNDVLKSEFGQTLGSKGVHILDPFTGTGTFITRLLQSGLIAPHELEHKYKHEIHANEIVLLAYYIAAINIEAVYHDMAKEHAIAQGESGEDMPYAPFDGIVLTDTFQLYEQDKDMIADLLPDNSERRTAQKERDIRVIVGNPPYSSGQQSEKDNNQNATYLNLDARITDTYVEKSSNKMGKSKNYDSYIRAIRWATDRVHAEGGVVAFVTGSAWLERSFADGMRECLSDDFTSLYIIHLRGDIRKNILSNGAAKEGENVFGSGSMTGIAISILVKNPSERESGQIFFRDIGDDLPVRHKLHFLKDWRALAGISQEDGWTRVVPNAQNDWIDQREASFGTYISMGDKRSKGSPQIFVTYSMGNLSNRDLWVYDASSVALEAKVRKMFATFEREREKAIEVDAQDIRKSISDDPKEIKWTTDIVSELKKNTAFKFDREQLQVSVFRPFQKVWWYGDAKWNWSKHLMPRMFPKEGVGSRSLYISGVGSRAGFSTFMVDSIPNKHTLDTGQCFPLKLYEPANADDGLFATVETGYTERDGISDAGLKHFQDAYAGEQISKEDLFYYIYGLLHSPDYRERFKNNLSKELPRIPAVKTAADFWAFSKAGRALGDLHVNYETVDPYPVVIAEGDLRLAHIPDPKAYYRVEKMKWGGKGKVKDKTTVHYNPRITMTGIPLEAYDYVVNGKPALDWVMERQCVKTDKASGIVNDANDYANETVGNPAYPLELFQRVITVSLETMKIVNGFPKLDID